MEGEPARGRNKEPVLGRALYFRRKRYALSPWFIVMHRVRNFFTGKEPESMKKMASKKEMKVLFGKPAYYSDVYIDSATKIKHYLNYNLIRFMLE